MGHEIMRQESAIENRQVYFLQVKRLAEINTAILFILHIIPSGFPRWLSGRIHLPMQETRGIRVQSLGQGDCLEEEMATHPSTLARKIL